MGTMPAHRDDVPLPERLDALVAKGDIRPGDGSRFLPKPVKPPEGAKRAADYVAEGHR